LQIPVLEIELDVAAAMARQELITNETAGVTYWEGAARATGQKGGKPTVASGYLEMTGYAPSRAWPR
jgi:predicted secreted hydrolase